MKKIALLLFSTLILVSCASIKPNVSLNLSDVNGVNTIGMSYIDDMITTVWSYTNKSRLNFKIKNNSKSTIIISRSNLPFSITFINERPTSAKLFPSPSVLEDL
jgi:hypothetical protein